MTPSPLDAACATTGHPDKPFVLLNVLKFSWPGCFQDRLGSSVSVLSIPGNRATPVDALFGLGAEEFGCSPGSTMVLLGRA